MTPEIVSSAAPLEPAASADRAAAQSAFAAGSGPFALRPRNSERTPGDPTALAAALLQERHVTLELQRAILPLHEAPFDLPGLRAVVRYLPASANSRVGGDWYITAEMPAGNVLLAIGDVAGHGLDAAAGMARLRGALAGLAITWLNDLVHHVAPEHTASVMAGYFDPPTREFTWAQAGHPPPLLVRGAAARPLGQPAGILLGAGHGGYDAMTLTLEPGDVLLLYSDGLVERRDRPLDQGLSLLAEAAAGISDPEQLITAVLDAVSSTDSEDDTCLVALRVL
jgi:serine phosphatase RsbU (regulator of sigma subunit)